MTIFVTNKKITLIVADLQRNKQKKYSHRTKLAGELEMTTEIYTLTLK